MALRIRLLAVLALALALALGSPAGAGTAPEGLYAWRSFAVDQGLTNLAVTAMAQDPEGFLWVGTEDGLFRLEGDRFRHFGEEDGLPSARIEGDGLAPGRTKGLWVSTGRGIALWNGRRFLRPSALGMEGMDERLGRCLVNGGAILSDRPRQVRYVSLDGEPFRPLTGLPWGAGLYAAAFDAQRGRVIAALGRELWIETGPGTWIRKDLSGVLSQGIQHLTVDREGRIWIRTPEQLGFLKDPEGAFEPLRTPRPLSAVNSGSVAFDPLGRLWANTAQGLLQWDGRRWLDLGEDAGLPRGGAVVQYVDRQGTLWIGGYGVHKMLGGGLWSGWTRQEGLPSDVVWTAIQTRDGRLWAGTGGGLAVHEAGGWRTLPNTAANQIFALTEDEDGNLWVGHTVSRERPFPLSVVPKGGREAQPRSLPGLVGEGYVGGIAAEGGRLWLAAIGGGLYRAERRGTALVASKVPIPGWAGDVSLQRVVLDGRGGLFVAGSPGVGHWDGRSWATMSKAQGLVEDRMTGLAAAPGTGEAWASYAEAKGLVKVGREGDRLVIRGAWSAPHPLTQHPVVTLLAEPDGVLWLGTSRGVLRWDGQRAERYDHHAGLPGDDCAQNGLWKTPEGDLLVGLSVGLARGRMALRQGDLLPAPAVILQAIRGDGASLLGAEGRAEVPWAGRTLTFRFGPRGSLGTEGLQQQVRLVGLEDAWLTTSLPEARYPDLSPGTYRFEVRTINGLGEVGPVEGLDLRIRAPWWRTPWMLGVYAFLLGGLGYGVYRWRTNLLRRRNEQLEMMVHERTEALELANAALREAALVDPLTTLYNRRYLTATMPEEENRLRRVFRTYLMRGESPLGRNEDLMLVLVDLDHFKRVNDTYGHAAGDQVLVQTAKVLRSNCRGSDSLVRWGGEEFLLVAKRTDRARGDLIADNLCTAIREHLFTLPDGQVIQVTASVGYAAFPILDQHPEAFTWEDTLQVADQCLYAAKRAGRNGWVGLHTPGPLDPADLGSRIRVDLEGLVKEEKLVLRASFAHPITIEAPPDGSR